MDSGDEQTADVWLERAVTISAESDYLAKDFEFLGLRIETGIYRGDFPRAGRILREGAAAGVFASSVSRRFHRAAEFAIQVGMGDIGPSTPAFARAIATDSLRTMTGVREFETAVVADVFTRLGLLDEARATLREYFATNSEPRPPSAFLRRTALRADCGSLVERGRPFGVVSSPETDPKDEG